MIGFSPNRLDDYLNLVQKLRSEEDIKRLSRALALGERNFCLLTCQSPLQTKACLAVIEDRVESLVSRSISIQHLKPGNLVEYDLEDLIDSLMRPLLRKQQLVEGKQIIILDGSGATAQKLSTWQVFFERMNLMRNKIMKNLAGPLILVVTDRLNLEFAANAPDFWSIRSTAARAVPLPPVKWKPTPSNSSQSRPIPPDDLQEFGETSSDPRMMRSRAFTLVAEANGKREKGEAKDALAMVQKAVAIYDRLHQSEFHDDLMGRVEAHVLEGRILIDLGRYSEARVSLNSALEQQEGTITSWEPWIFLNLAITYAGDRKMDIARKNLQKSLDRFRYSIKDESENVEKRFSLAQATKIIAETGLLTPIENIELLEEGLESINDIEEPRTKGIIYELLGLNHFAEGGHEKALACMSTSLQMRIRLGDRVGEHRICLGLAYMQQNRGDFDSAFHWVDRASRISEEMGDHEREKITNDVKEEINLYRNALNAGMKTEDQP